MSTVKQEILEKVEDLTEDQAQQVLKAIKELVNKGKSSVEEPYDDTFDC